MNPQSQPYPDNPFASRAFGGVAQPQKYQDRSFNYTYPINLTALQSGLVDQVSIETDSDFYMEAWYVSSSTGGFTIQLTDATGYQLQSGQIQSAGLSSSAADPTVFSPAHPFPAGSKIQILITDISGAPNVGQIVFIGTKRFITPTK